MPPSFEVMPLILDWSDGKENLDSYFAAKRPISTTMNGNVSPKVLAHHLPPLDFPVLNGNITSSPHAMTPIDLSSSPTTYSHPPHTFTAPAASHIPKPIDTTLRVPQQPHRRSSPSRYSHPPAGNPSTTSFESIAKSNPPPLQHRHTLEVPRSSTQLPRPSREYPLRPSADSDGYINGTPTSPTTPGRRRPSTNLTRRLTRSLHSDLHLDDGLPEEDSSRFADRVRNKRLSRRRRKEEEEDDRVLVGTKVDQNHVNWVTAYNMLTGIRFTVSRTNAKKPPEVLDAQHFAAKHKFSFDV
jgi:1-phosphatidylinositol-4-phosphate 5-kinase